MFVRPRSRPSLLLLLLCAALAWVVAQELEGGFWPHGAATVETPPSATFAAPKPLPAFTLPQLAQLDSMVTRPLFLPQRRPIEPEPPPPEPVKPAPKVEKPPLEVVISGVIMAETRQFALVQRLSGGDTLRLAKGDTIDGWSVASVLADRVVFQRNAETQEVALKDGKPKPPKAKKPTRKRRRATPPKSDGSGRTAPQRQRRTRTRQE